MTGEEAGARQADSASKLCPEADVLSPSLGSAKDVKRWVRWVIPHRLSGREPVAMAARAQLRHGVGKEVGAIPSIWMYTLGAVDTAWNCKGEKAVHTALTLWARHQGSNAAPMHMVEAKETPRSFGGAVRALAEKGRGDKRPEETPVYRRLSSVVSAQTYEALEHHLRGIVDLLEAAEIPMDYGLLAADLFEWQDSQDRSAVTRRWGRQFARAPIPTESAGDKAPE